MNDTEESVSAFNEKEDYLKKLNLEDIDVASEPLEEIDEVLKQRKALWKPRPLKYTKGALGLYVKHAVSPMKGGYME